MKIESSTPKTVATVDWWSFLGGGLLFINIWVHHINLVGMWTPFHFFVFCGKSLTIDDTFLKRCWRHLWTFDYAIFILPSKICCSQFCRVARRKRGTPNNWLVKELKRKYLRKNFTNWFCFWQKSTSWLFKQSN